MILPRRTLRRLTHYSIFAFICLWIFYLSLANDSAIYLAIRFNLGRLSAYLRGAGRKRDAWLWKPGKYPVDLRTDVGLLIKTGYGTKERLPAHLEAYGLTQNDNDTFIVVSDYTPRNPDDEPVEVFDAIAEMLDLELFSGLETAPRFSKYKALQGAIVSGYDEKAKHLGKSFGWELDAMKVCCCYYTSFFGHVS
jgi:hypothetical protein